MPTYTALTTLPDGERAAALAETMEATDPAPEGIGVFEMEDGSGLWEVGGYFTEPPDEVALAVMAAAFGARPFAISALPETDWVAKVRRELVPVTAGRFFVHGAHDADRVPEGAVALRIEAAMAFGTGHHGTTQGCLLAIERLIGAGVVPRAVIDVGCGTAVLAMAAARAWDIRVIASDVDPVAVEVAQVNVAENGLAEQVFCVEAAGLDHTVLAEAAPYDLLFANILKGPLIDLAPDMAEACAPGGMAILSGLLVEQAEDVIAAYDAVGFALSYREDLGDWATLTLVRQP